MSAISNGDGRADLGVTLADASFLVLLRNPAGGFDAPVVIAPANAAFANFLPGTTFGTGWERGADFNGDGHADLARIVFAPGSTTTAVTEILLGDGTGTNFTFSTRMLVGPFQDKFAIDDFDGDGRPDLGILRLDSPTVVVLPNNCGAATKADLEVELQGPAGLANGATGTYVATVTNHGPDLADNAFVVVVAPPGMTPVSVTADVGDCDVESDGALGCGLSPFASGETRTITAVVRAVASGSRVVFAEVLSDAADEVGTNNTATVQTTIAAGCGDARRQQHER